MLGLCTRVMKLSICTISTMSSRLMNLNWDQAANVYACLLLLYLLVFQHSGCHTSYCCYNSLHGLCETMCIAQPTTGPCMESGVCMGLLLKRRPAWGMHCFRHLQGWSILARSRSWCGADHGNLHTLRKLSKSCCTASASSCSSCPGSSANDGLGVACPGFTSLATSPRRNIPRRGITWHAYSHCLRTSGKAMGAFSSLFHTSSRGRRAGLVHPSGPCLTWAW